MMDAAKNALRAISRLAVVRLFVFFAVLIAIYAGAQAGWMSVVDLIPAPWRDWATLTAATAVALVLLGCYTLLVRWFERRAARELWPLRGGLFLAGVIAAFVAFCSIYAVLWKLGAAHWQGIGGLGGVKFALAVAVLSSIGEELIFRGVLFRILEDSLGTLLALVLSSAVFGATHLLNPNATLFSALAVALEAGIVLGAAYTATRSLWLPIGIHFGWNFTEGGVFGAEVSGRFGGHGMVNMPLSGSDLLTGGPFGPETSVVAVAILFGFGLLFVALSIRRGRWQPLRFRMMLVPSA